jgi:CHAD domain-containing protein
VLVCVPDFIVKTAPAEEKKSGLVYWMGEVLKEAGKAEAGFAPDPVHDLRVALRRCRSISEGFQAIDPDPAWKKMRKAGKDLFSSLGDLRDCQVMTEWITRLGAADDPVTQRLLEYCRDQEQTLKVHAAELLQGFDRKQWESWARLLPRRAARLRMENGPFQCLALERWAEAHKLHKTAIKTRSKLGLHRLRIGLKKFRYVVENFLPQQYQLWGGGLKEIQDLLGEVHDLDVLLATAIRIGAFPAPEDRQRWQQRIEEERKTRVEKYREKTLGKDSLWSLWRSGLPEGKEAEQAVYKKLRVWASHLDSDVQHSQRVARLTLQLHDGLARVGVLEKNGANSRALLKAAAIMHDVGRSAGSTDHHKATQRMVLRLGTPFGWKQEDLDMAALIARYHRGSLPRDQKRFLSLPPNLQRATKCLAGMLRLADALDRSHEGAVRRLKVTRAKPGEFVVVYAEGLDEESPLAETIAGARHLLESSCGIPIVVRAM